MRHLLLLSATALLLLTSACTNMPGIVKALSNDSAFVTVEVNTIYGKGFIVRDGRPNSANTITDTGAVSSTPSTNAVNFRPDPAQPLQTPTR